MVKAHGGKIYLEVDQNVASRLVALLQNSPGCGSLENLDQVLQALVAIGVEPFKDYPYGIAYK